ncbi:MAG: hypothetical protein NT013_17650 [Planctomycetia bacterium]|nr:hypothetical protein [Planctomycetia bacterium]
MSQSPRWLPILIRIRDHRRDAALQSLAAGLNVAKTANDATESTAAKLSQLNISQQQCNSTHRLDIERLRQLQIIRDGLRAELAERIQDQTDAAAKVKQAQQAAVARDSEREILVRLADRYQAANRLNERRCEEQILWETSVTLCNGDCSP